MATLGNYTHMYIIYYRAGSGGVEGNVTISGYTHWDCCSAVTGVEADSANYTVTMATVNEDDSLSYRSEATVAVRASECQENCCLLFTYLLLSALVLRWQRCLPCHTNRHPVLV